MRIHFLRHGECSDQAFLRGRCASSLTAKGLDASLSSARLVLNLSGKNLWCVSSKAPRCQQIYAALQAENLPMLQGLERLPAGNVLGELSELWQERDFGVFDGLSLEAIKANFHKELEAYLNDPFNFVPRGAESLQAFSERLTQAWQLLLRTLQSHHIEECLLLTHGGPMRWVFSKVTGAPIEQTFHLEMAYASLLTIEVIEPVENSPAGNLENDSQVPFCRLIGLHSPKQFGGSR